MRSILLHYLFLSGYLVCLLPISFSLLIKGDDVSAIEIHLSTEKSHVLVGDEVQWIIEISPLTDEGIVDLSFDSLNSESWQWLDLGNPPALITTTLTLSLTAVPLTIGEMSPIIEARYSRNGMQYSQLVSSNHALTVESVDNYLLSRLTILNNTVNSSQKIPLELNLDNQSSFLMNQITVEGKGLDLFWDTVTPVIDLQPGDSVNVFLWANVSGQNPQPQIQINYQWLDAAGNTRMLEKIIEGKSLLYKPLIIESIPDEVWGILIGVITTLVTLGITSLWEKSQRWKINRYKVSSILELSITQAKHSATHGILVNIAPLESVYKEEGLFDIASKYGFVQELGNLWQMMERYNNGLTLPGGGQRSDDLKKAANSLEVCLNFVKKNYTLFRISRMFRNLNKQERKKQ